MSAMPREPEKVFQGPGDRLDEILKPERPRTSLPNQIALEKMNEMMKDQSDHKLLWETFTNRPAQGRLFESFVRENNLKKKKSILLRYAVDSDDALWLSKEMLAIEARRGDTALWKVHHKDAHSASELDYSKTGAVDHGQRKAENR
jgi:hypothetical protein|tara:strand:- start:2124 stop:2561 length:438 start_codon:yes stop_codon:yes gene_type:complete